MSFISYHLTTCAPTSSIYLLCFSFISLPSLGEPVVALCSPSPIFPPSSPSSSSASLLSPLLSKASSFSPVARLAYSGIQPGNYYSIVSLYTFPDASKHKSTTTMTPSSSSKTSTPNSVGDTTPMCHVVGLIDPFGIASGEFGPYSSKSKKWPKELKKKLFPLRFIKNKGDTPINMGTNANSTPVANKDNKNSTNCNSNSDNKTSTCVPPEYAPVQGLFFMDFSDLINLFGSTIIFRSPSTMSHSEVKNIKLDASISSMTSLISANARLLLKQREIDPIFNDYASTEPIYFNKTPQILIDNANEKSDFIAKHVSYQSNLSIIHTLNINNNDRNTKNRPTKVVPSVSNKAISSKSSNNDTIINIKDDDKNAVDTPLSIKYHQCQAFSLECALRSSAYNKYQTEENKERGNYNDNIIPDGYYDKHPYVQRTNQMYNIISGKSQSNQSKRYNIPSVMASLTKSMIGMKMAPIPANCDLRLLVMLGNRWIMKEINKMMSANHNTHDGFDRRGLRGASSSNNNRTMTTRDIHAESVVHSNVSTTVLIVQVHADIADIHITKHHSSSQSSPYTPNSATPDGMMKGRNHTTPNVYDGYLHHSINVFDLSSPPINSNDCKTDEVSINRRRNHRHLNSTDRSSGGSASGSSSSSDDKSNPSSRNSSSNSCNSNTRDNAMICRVPLVQSFDALPDQSIQYPNRGDFLPKFDIYSTTRSSNNVPRDTKGFYRRQFDRISRYGIRHVFEADIPDNVLLSHLKGSNKGMATTSSSTMYNRYNMNDKSMPSLYPEDTVPCDYSTIDNSTLGEGITANYLNRTIARKFSPVYQNNNYNNTKARSTHTSTHSNSSSTYHDDTILSCPLFLRLKSLRKGVYAIVFSTSALASSSNVPFEAFSVDVSATPGVTFNTTKLNNISLGLASAVQYRDYLSIAAIASLHNNEHYSFVHERLGNHLYNSSHLTIATDTSVFATSVSINTISHNGDSRPINLNNCKYLSPYSPLQTEHLLILLSKLIGTAISYPILRFAMLQLSGVLSHSKPTLFNTITLNTILPNLSKIFNVTNIINGFTSSCSYAISNMIHHGPFSLSTITKPWKGKLLPTNLALWQHTIRVYWASLYSIDNPTFHVILTRAISPFHISLYVFLSPFSFLGLSLALLIVAVEEVISKIIISSSTSLSSASINMSLFSLVYDSLTSMHLLEGLSQYHSKVFVEHNPSFKEWLRLPLSRMVGDSIRDSAISDFVKPKAQSHLTRLIHDNATLLRNTIDHQVKSATSGYRGSKKRLRSGRATAISHAASNLTASLPSAVATTSTTPQSKPSASLLPSSLGPTSCRALAVDTPYSYITAIHPLCLRRSIVLPGMAKGLPPSTCFESAVPWVSNEILLSSQSLGGNKSRPCSHEDVKNGIHDHNDRLSTNNSYYHADENDHADGIASTNVRNSDNDNLCRISPSYHSMPTHLSSSSNSSNRYLINNTNSKISDNYFDRRSTESTSSVVSRADSKASLGTRTDTTAPSELTYYSNTSITNSDESIYFTRSDRVSDTEEVKLGTEDTRLSHSSQPTRSLITMTNIALSMNVESRVESMQDEENSDDEDLHNPYGYPLIHPASTLAITHYRFSSLVSDALSLTSSAHTLYLYNLIRRGEITLIWSASTLSSLMKYFFHVNESSAVSTATTRATTLRAASVTASTEAQRAVLMTSPAAGASPLVVDLCQPVDAIVKYISLLPQSAVVVPAVLLHRSVQTAATSLALSLVGKERERMAAMTNQEREQRKGMWRKGAWITFAVALALNVAN